MRAYFYDDIVERLPHDSGLHVSAEMLTSLCVLYWHIPIDAEDTGSRIDAIAKERAYNYKNRYVINMTKKGLGDAYEEKLKIFFADIEMMCTRLCTWDEDMHENEEIWYIKTGPGFFDVRERWIRVHLTLGDLLVLAAVIYYRFTLDEGNAVTALRLFKDEPKWMPYSHSTETDANPFGQSYVQSMEA